MVTCNACSMYDALGIPSPVIAAYFQGQTGPSLRGLPSLKSPPRTTLATRSPIRKPTSSYREAKVLAPAPTLDDSAAWSDGTPTPEPRRVTAALDDNRDYTDNYDNDHDDNYDNDDGDTYHHNAMREQLDEGSDHSRGSTPTPHDLPAAVRRTTSSDQGEAPRPQSKLMQRFFGHTQAPAATHPGQAPAQHQPTQLAATPAAIVTRGDSRPPMGGAVDVKLGQLDEEIALFKRETAALDTLKQQHARST